MKKLTNEEINKFASRRGVSKEAVLKFFSNISDSPLEVGQQMLDDARLYRWNEATFRAIQDGVMFALSKG